MVKDVNRVLSSFYAQSSTKNISQHKATPDLTLEEHRRVVDFIVLLSQLSNAKKAKKATASGVATRRRRKRAKARNLARAFSY